MEKIVARIKFTGETRQKPTKCRNMPNSAAMAGRPEIMLSRLCVLEVPILPCEMG